MFTIVEHNDDFVIINKRPGITVQRELDDPGLLELVAAELGLVKLLPVHRLDKMTSGLLLMAKHTQANQVLSVQFARRQVQKYYLAISHKKPKKKQGLIRGDMSKARRGTWKLLGSQGNPAVTQFFSQSLGAGQRLFLLRPHTGKTHQIRVAMKSLGAPIWGDVAYAGVEAAADRGYLHAYSLSFDWGGEALTYQCLPETGEHFQDERFLTVVQAWGAPGVLNWPQV